MQSMAQLLSSCFFTLPLLTPFTGARDPIFWAARRRPLPQGTLRREHRLSSYLGKKLHLGDVITIRAQAVALVLEQEAAPRPFVIEKARCPSLLRERGFDLNSAACCPSSRIPPRSLPAKIQGCWEPAKMRILQQGFN